MLVIGPLLLYAIWFACVYVLNCIKCFYWGATTNVRLLLSISGKTGRNASEEVLFALIKSKCLPVLFQDGQEDEETTSWFFAIPYVENVSEAVARIMRKHNVPVAMKSYKTLKTVLVHPKDKQEKEDLTECVYKVPCWVRFGQFRSDSVRFGQFRSDSVNCRTG